MQNHTERAASLVSRMTLEEKVAQLCSAWLEIEESGDFRVRSLSGATQKSAEGDASAVLKYGIGQITRPLGTRPMDAKACVRGLNRIQKRLVEGTRLGIPALPHEECLTGLMAQGATLFPSALNYGSLWDEELMKKIASVIGDEVFSVGSRQGLAPVLDVSRDVRWGRTEESMGEDPYLVGCLASAWVSGFQGPRKRLLATLKHFAGHSFSEGARNHAPVRVGERELSDVFLLPFEMAVKTADAGSLMPAYHDIDGLPCSSSRRLLTGILREEWGFDGIVVSDYEGLTQLWKDHRVCHDVGEAAAASLEAGMDMDLPGDTCFRTGIESAISRGILPMETVDRAVLRVLTMKDRLGLFEHPYTDEGAVCLNTPEHRDVAREAAEKSLVLLRNDGTLPLQHSGKVALIGPLADDRFSTLCGYSFPVHLITSIRKVDDGIPYTKTLREALTERLGAGHVLYSRGCDVLTKRPLESPVFPGDSGMETGQRESYVSRDESMIRDAVETAKRADSIVLAVGDLSGLFLAGTVGEGSDASSLALPGVQGKLLEALLAVGKPLVLVVVSGRPYYEPTFMKAGAVLEAWLPGQGGAEAIVGVLAGDVNPGGKLPVSVPKSAGAMPYFYNHPGKSAGTPIQEDFGAAFPFGHGLSFTEFRYRDFSIDREAVPVDGTFRVSLTVENVGRREGDEVVQLYVRDLYASRVRPVKELKAFKRLTLEPNRTARVVFELPADLLGFTLEGTKRIVEPGEFELMIGSSSADIRWKTVVTLTGAVRTLPADRRMVAKSEVEFLENVKRNV